MKKTTHILKAMLLFAALSLIGNVKAVTLLNENVSAALNQNTVDPVAINAGAYDPAFVTTTVGNWSVTAYSDLIGVTVNGAPAKIKQLTQTFTLSNNYNAQSVTVNTGVYKFGLTGSPVARLYNASMVDITASVAGQSLTSDISAADGYYIGLYGVPVQSFSGGGAGNIVTEGQAHTFTLNTSVTLADGNNTVVSGTAQGGTALVPEPSVTGLLVLVGCCVLRRKRQ